MVGVVPCCLPWRRVSRDRRAPGADVVEIVVGAIQPGSPGRQEPVRPIVRDVGGIERLGPARTRGGGGSQISPETMSALLAAQSQSSAGVGDHGIHEPLGCAEGSVLADRCRRRRQDHQDRNSKNALGAGGTNLAAGRRRVLQARQERRRLRQPRRDVVGAEGRPRRSPSTIARGSGDGDGCEFRSLLAGPAGRLQHDPSPTADGSTTTTLTYADGSKMIDDAAAGKAIQHQRLRPTISSSR